MTATELDGHPRRRALLVANGNYPDPQLHNLASPRNDAAALARVLSDPALGGFEVRTILEKEEPVVRREIYDLFHGAGRNDFTLLYFSCHGLKDEYGELFFAARDTEVERVPPTAIAADYVREQIERSACMRVVVIADCCYAGAFVRGLRAKSAVAEFELEAALGGTGRVVIAATSSTTRAYENSDPSDIPDDDRLSYFTAALVEGIDSGAADTDSDGLISVMDAFHYAEDWLRGRGIPQQPRVSLWNIEGRLLLARAPVRAVAPRIERARPKPRLSAQDARWYHSAVFYEVLVRAFVDTDGDGTGDLAGLDAKLDYLLWLGADCLILVGAAEYPRTGPDQPRDVAGGGMPDDLGDLDDFARLVEKAHAYGMRVVVDVAMSYTSDRHPWFQESRSDRDGRNGDLYLWSDPDELSPDARITDASSETSGWTFDPGREQYYFHRFSAHQPDLNFENPAAAEAVVDASRFWLALGADGIRLRAVPRLFAVGGVRREYVPRTHDVLRRIRTMVDADYPDRVVLCEADEWPADVVEYYGKGDECHVALHFPLTARLFMAVRRESRFPISEMMAQTPEIPEICQWGIFLRNRDELSLEMMADEERDYMYREYAPDPRMRTDTGIRRRLAPLLSNDRNQLELFTALLLSLPGSPVLYYGDEIGMGDNIWLGDRNAVRTPMQWVPDRNAGFSPADPHRLILPVVADPVHGYQATNVEAQIRDTASLLHRTRQMIEVRGRHPAFGLGTYVEVGSPNPAILSYLREFDDDIVLCVNNLSRFQQPVSLDLRWYEGCTPIELMGQIRFPPIGALPYPLALGPHSFIWLTLESG